MKDVVRVIPCPSPLVASKEIWSKSITAVLDGVPPEEALVGIVDKAQLCVCHEGRYEYRILSKKTATRLGLTSLRGKQMLTEQTESALFVSAMSGPDATMRSEALMSSLKFARKSAIPIGLLDKALWDDPSPAVRAAAAETVGRLAATEMTNHMADAQYRLFSTLSVALGEEEDANVRRAIVFALSRIDYTDVVGMLILALEDDSEVVREAALEELKKRVNPKIRAILRRRNKDRGQRLRALQSDFKGIGGSSRRQREHRKPPRTAD